MLKCRHSEALPVLITAFVRVISKNQLIRLLKIKSKNKCVRKKKNKFSFKNIDLVLHTTGTCSYNCHFFAALFRRQRRQGGGGEFWIVYVEIWILYVFTAEGGEKVRQKSDANIVFMCCLCSILFRSCIKKHVTNTKKLEFLFPATKLDFGN